MRPEITLRAFFVAEGSHAGSPPRGCPAQHEGVLGPDDEGLPHQALSLGGLFPDDWPWLDRQYRMARQALEACGLDLTPCFNDPMPGYFMLNASCDQMLLIDYEYASNNERCYELGIWFGEMFFEEGIERELIARYFDEVRQDHIACC